MEPVGLAARALIGAGGVVGEQTVRVAAPTRSGIQDVAALAGVSAATVSRSLSGHVNVAAQTRQRVLDAARELGYVVSPQASGLASGRTRAVAVVVPFITRWYFSTVVAGVADVLRRSGYDAVLYHLGSAEDRDHFFERMPLARRVDGILTLSMPLNEEHTLALRALDIPLVSVGAHVPGSASVRIDDAAAAQTAVNHLVHQGHQRIGFIAGLRTTWCSGSSLRSTGVVATSTRCSMPGSR